MKNRNILHESSLAFLRNAQQNSEDENNFSPKIFNEILWLAEKL